MGKIEHFGGVVSVIKIHYIVGVFLVGGVQNFSHFGLAERRPALAHAVMASLICWSFNNSMFRYLLVDHAVPAM